MARPPFVGPGYRGLLGGQTPEIPETDLYAIRNTATTSTDLPQGSIRRASFPSRHGHDASQVFVPDYRLAPEHPYSMAAHLREFELNLMLVMPWGKGFRYSAYEIPRC
ncbi:hypothetical protein VSDG_00588 [Cytospora chrysosperma]|uniref:Uncharacterized protein n=1 Tax=Cytospora chrysosperma TaxID=252740 RepID=A0A423WPY8_CYTCH|nr:hypothetical protein VSDG_00588 [Valsa sordida]